MEKKLILVTAPPACGKTYVSEALAEALGNAVLLDKDDLAPLIRAGFAVAGEEMDYDGAFYRDNLRPAEYETLLHLAFSTLRFEKYVLLAAPFGRELRRAPLIAQWRERANAMGAELVLIWVDVPVAVRYERMKSRSSDRDTKKLEHWEEYAATVCDEAPLGLKDAVDRWILLDNKDGESFERCLQETVSKLTEA
ncbi:MAG: AAA family ATPase [Clostridia bacterium]|nr:AAA family ATPase [Clostridia bacterium]